MSENLDLVRSIYAAWERGDFSRAEWADPQIEFVLVGGPTPGQSTGIPAMARAWRTFVESWSEYRAEPKTFRDLDGTRVLVLIRGIGRGKASGVEVDIRNANVFEISGGKVTRLAVYADPAEALAAVGLEE